MRGEADFHAIMIDFCASVCENERTNSTKFASSSQALGSAMKQIIQKTKRKEKGKIAELKE
jgi:hypothetical protein